MPKVKRKVNPFEDSPYYPKMPPTLQTIVDTMDRDKRKAEEFNVSVVTIRQWKKDPEKKKAICKGYEEYVNGLCDKILELYQNGASTSEIASFLQITLGDLRKWQSKHAYLKEICELGETFSRAYWDKLGKDNIENKYFGIVNYIWQMKTRFGLYDNLMQDQFIKKSDDGSHDVEVKQIEVRIKKMLIREMEKKDDRETEKS